MSTLSYSVLVMGLPLVAAITPETGWVKADHHRYAVGGEVATTWFHPSAEYRQGVFEVLTPETEGPVGTVVSGDFSVMSFRYTFERPVGETVPAGTAGFEEVPPQHDELTMKVLLDCERHLSATSEITYLLHGDPVRHQRFDDSEIMMIRTDPHGTTVGDLCQFAHRDGAENKDG